MTNQKSNYKPLEKMSEAEVMERLLYGRFKGELARYHFARMAAQAGIIDIDDKIADAGVPAGAEAREWGRDNGYAV